MPPILGLKHLPVAPHRHPLSIKPQMQLIIPSFLISRTRCLSRTWATLFNLNAFTLFILAQYPIIKIYPVVQRRHKARMPYVLHLLIHRHNCRIIFMKPYKLLDIRLIIFPRQQLCQDNSQPFTTGSYMRPFSMLLHYPSHHLPLFLILDGLGIKQPIIHLCRIFLQMVAVDKEQSCIHCSLSTSRTTFLIPCSPCHHRQHLLSRTNILARLLQLCYLSQTVLGLL